ncbi:MlaD family protein [Gordonia aurantiaca]|uniref:MlaD family protein n=1 Tax=Gordonia sp. B21 TaxID=3151852 RepID=UPI0032632EA8
MSSRPALLRRAAAILVMCLLASACGPTLTDIPLGAGGRTDATIRIRAEFASVLNLPDRARVLMDGVETGTVVSTELAGDRAIAVIDLDRTRRVPVGTRAELRQTTLLGDIYVALVPPTHPVGDAVLVDGSMIPLDHTEPPINVETMLTTVGNLVNGGTLTRLQSAIRDVNGALDVPSAELRRIAAAGAAAVTGLGENTGPIQAILERADQVAATVAAQRHRIDEILTHGETRLGGLSNTLLSVVDLIIAVGGLGRGVAGVLNPVHEELTSMLATVDPWLVTIANADRSVAENAHRAAVLVRDRLVPFLRGGSLDIVSVTDTGRDVERARDVTDILRGLGLL